MPTLRVDPSSLFAWLLHTTFQASVLILMVLVLSLAMRRYIEARWRSLLWLLVLVRLVLPVVPASSVSLFNWIGGGPVRPVGESVLAVPATPQGVPVLPAGLSSGPQLNAADSELPLSLVRQGPAPQTPSVDPGISIDQRGLSLWEIGLLVWAAGAGGLAVYVAWINVRLWIAIRKARAVQDPAVLALLDECRKRMGLRAAPLLVESPQARMPALFGLFRPRLVLPVGMAGVSTTEPPVKAPAALRAPAALPTERLRHIFLHELAHLKRRDLLTGWLAACVQVIHWFNPLVWLAFRRMRADREVAADALALAALRPAEPRQYAETLIELAQFFSRPAPLAAVAGILEGHADLKRRIASIARPRRISRMQTILMPILVVLVGCVGLTDSSESRGPSDRSNMNDAGKQGLATPRPAAITDSPDSTVDASGRIVDRIDYPFVDDPQVVGRWQSVDFVREVEDFDPAAPKWKGSLYLKELVLLPEGQSVRPWWIWTKGLIIHKDDRTASKYVIREINATTYMFFEWKSGDYTIRHEKPQYYVLKKVSSDVSDMKPLPRNTGTRPAVIADSPDSTVDASGRIVDRIDYPFVDDPQAIGKWESVDFVTHISDFDPAARKWKGDLFFKQMILLPNGKSIYASITWTKGLICDAGDRTASKYVIRQMNGSTYMFYEWKSGDYVIFHMRPSYYVLMKVSSDVSGVKPAWLDPRASEAFQRELPEKVAKLDISKAGRADVIRLFGEPGQYSFENKVFGEDHLPDYYVMLYPASFSVFMHKDQIVELRFEAPGYRFEGKFQVGDSLEKALEVMGRPTRTVNGEKLLFEDGVLYKNAKRGVWATREGYYARKDRNVRIFFQDDKVTALYVTRPAAE